MSEAPARRGSRTSRSRTSRAGSRRPSRRRRASARSSSRTSIYGWSAAAGDFNHDGVLDVTIGNRYYLGPSFTESRELYAAQTLQPGEGVLPGDGELRRSTTPATAGTTSSWSNRGRPCSTSIPKGSRGAGRATPVFTAPVMSESIMFKDINGDGKPDVDLRCGSSVQWVGVDPVESDGNVEDHHGVAAGRAVEHSRHRRRATSTATARWTSSRRTAGGSSPRRAPTQTPWTFHQGAFGRNGNAGGNMEVYDVNGDKLPDVVTALAAHGFGLAWYEQKRDAGGEDLVRRARDHERLRAARTPAA